MDLSHLSKSEQESIWKVLQRDEKLRKQNEQHVTQLRAELQGLRRRGALRGGLDPVYSCARCRAELGRIINRGALCPVCRVKVCKVCRVHGNDAAHWVCIVCHKQMEIQVATGEWMNEFVRRPSRRRDPKAYVPATHSIKLSITSPRGSAVACPLEGVPAARSPVVGRGRRNPGLTVDQCPTITLAPTPSPSLSPSPSPRTKSPLLKQQAIVDEALNRSALPAAFRRSDFSDSGVENPSAGSPKTSQSSDQSWMSTDSGAPMDPYRGGRRCHRLGSSPINPQGTESVSDASDAEMDHEQGTGATATTGVVFRKVTLKRNRAGPSREGDNDLDDSNHAATTLPLSSCSPPLLPSSSDNNSHTLPNRFAYPALSLWNQVGSSFSFPRSKEARFLSANTHKIHVSSATSSLVARSDSNDSLWWDNCSSPSTPARARKALKVPRASGNSGCWWSRSASWDDLSAMDNAEDRTQNQEADLTSDLLSTVADKIVPEGEEYRLVFISSSSSSKSSGLDVEEECGDAQGSSPTFSLEEVEMADHVREMVTRSLSGSSDSAEGPVTLRDTVSVYVRGNSTRSSGERSLDEVSCWDHVVPFREDPERVVLHSNPGADVVTISVDCSGGAGSSGLLVGEMASERTVVHVDEDVDDIQFLFLEVDEHLKEAPKEPPPPIPTELEEEEYEGGDGPLENTHVASELVVTGENQVLDREKMESQKYGSQCSASNDPVEQVDVPAVEETEAGVGSEDAFVEFELPMSEFRIPVNPEVPREVELEMPAVEFRIPEDPDVVDVEEAECCYDVVSEGTVEDAVIADAECSALELEGSNIVSIVPDLGDSPEVSNAPAVENSVVEVVELELPTLEFNNSVTEDNSPNAELVVEEMKEPELEEDLTKEHELIEEPELTAELVEKPEIEEELKEDPEIEKLIHEHELIEELIEESEIEEALTEEPEIEQIKELAKECEIEEALTEDPERFALDVEMSNVTTPESEHIHDAKEVSIEDEEEAEEVAAVVTVEDAKESDESSESCDEETVIAEDSPSPATVTLTVHEKLQQLIAQSRAVSEASRQMKTDNSPLSLGLDSGSSSVLERYYTTTLEQRGPQAMRMASPTSPRRRASPASPQPMETREETEEEEEGGEEEEQEGEEEEASWDDGTSSSSSYSSSSSSSEDDYYDGEAARSVAVRNLDRSLHTILEESCEESESEQKVCPSLLPRGQQRSVASADPSQLERYFQMAFGGERKRSSWDGSEISDTTSETSSSIFSENTDFGDHDEEEDEDDAVALASSRLEKYFLGFSGCPHPGTSSPVDDEGCPTPRPDPSDESNDELSPTAFDKNDGCDTIKRNKKHKGLSSDEEDPAAQQGGTARSRSNPQTPAQNTGTQRSQETGKPEGQNQSGGENCSLEGEGLDGTPVTGCEVTVVMTVPCPEDPVKEIGSGSGAEEEKEKEEAAKVNLDQQMEEVVATAEDFGGITMLGNFVGRALTMDRKQQSRDSGFIGSSDDLLREESSSSSGSSSVGFESYGGNKEDREERKVSVTVEEETRYIVTQLMSQMTKSMSRSPQMARAKPPEILAFESELTKLMQTVPGIDDTVKEIIEELSSTDYCSDSYESSDYTSSDPDGLFTPTPSSRHSRRLSAAVSGLAASPLPSPTPSNRSINKEPLSEDTMYIYQRFMMSLAKMAEHVSEEESGGTGGVAAGSEKGSPPTAVKVVQHVRDRLTFLMREVQGESSYPRKNFRRRPGSDAASLCSTNSTTSSATAAGMDGDSEGSPTDTETSVDSDDGFGLSKPTVKSTVASPVGTVTEGLELERWNSDATIVEHMSQTPSRAESVGGSAGSVFCPSSPLSARSRRASESRSRSRLSRPQSRAGTGALSASVDALEKPAQQKAEHRRPRSLLSSRGKAGSAFCLRDQPASGGSQEWKPHYGSCWQLRGTSCESPRQGGSLQDMYRSTPEDLPACGARTPSESPGPVTQQPVAPVQQHQRTYQRSIRNLLLGGRSQPPSRFQPPLPQLGPRTQSASHGSLCPKASTLPRGANDLHANVSFLHNSVSGLLTTSNTNLAPQTFAAQQPPQSSSNRLSVDTADGTACRREIKSWPDKTCSQSVDNMNSVTVTPPQPSCRYMQRMAKGVGGGSSQELHVPSAFRDNQEGSPGYLKVNTGSAAGSSDREEEDIDRIVALHINRGSVSSLAVRSESMSSVYSAAGGGHYGAIAVRGEVQFGLSYNYMTGTLGVLVKQCRDLASVNAKHNRSDPYVKVYLLPDKSKGGKRKTRVKRHSLNPTFDELLKFPVTISELETRTLWLTVWHSDMFGRNEFLGEVTLPMGYVAFDDPLPKWYPLQERLGPPDEVFSYKGDLVIALKFVPPDVTNQKKGKGSRGALHVLVKEAHNLTAMRSNGTSDPFCKSYLLPDKAKNGKQKTAVVKRNCSPKWNHTFVYGDMTTEELSGRCLELTLWDYDRITSNDFLGGVRLSLGGGKYQGKDVEWMDSQGDEVSVWQEMLDRPNCWVDATLLLRPTMDPRQF